MIVSSKGFGVKVVKSVGVSLINVIKPVADISNFGAENANTCKEFAGAYEYSMSPQRVELYELVAWIYYVAPLTSPTSMSSPLVLLS